MRISLTVASIIVLFLLPVMLCAQAELEENLFTNWEFDDGTNGWTLLVDASAEATNFLDEDAYLSGDNSLRWEIVSGGDNFWNIQTYQTAPIEPDIEYFIDFLVYHDSSEPLNVWVKWELGGDPYTQYFYEQFLIETQFEISRVQTNFVAQDEDETANLKIFLGNPNLEVFVWLDRIYVGEYPLDDLTGIEDQTLKNQIPTSFELMQNYPNPFNPSTQVSYSLGEQAQISLQVYNQLGQLVNTLTEGTQSSGTYTIQWNGLDMNGADTASGVYIIKMQAIGKNQIFTDFIKAIKIK